MATTTQPYIRCNACKRKSYNHNDILNTYCGACHKFHERPADYTLGSTERAASAEDMHQMANACALYLTQIELAIVVKAFLESPDELVHELGQRHEPNRALTPIEWAQLVVTSARAALVMREVESILKTYYDERSHAEVRRILGPERDPDFFAMMIKAIGVIDEKQWTAWVMRCIDVALEADETRTKEQAT